MTVIDVDLDHLRGGNGIVRLRVSYTEMLNKSTETLALLLILLKLALGSVLRLTQLELTQPVSFRVIRLQPILLNVRLVRP
jgi:hypothetical protein